MAAQITVQMANDVLKGRVPGFLGGDLGDAAMPAPEPPSKRKLLITRHALDVLHRPSDQHTCLHVEGRFYICGAGCHSCGACLTGLGGVWGDLCGPENGSRWHPYAVRPPRSVDDLPFMYPYCADFGLVGVVGCTCCVPT